MNMKLRTWMLLGSLLLMSAWYFRDLRDAFRPPPATSQVPAGATEQAPPLRDRFALLPPAPAAVPAATAVAPLPGEPAFLLRNTVRPAGELARDDRALLLRNALVDTADKRPLVIPVELTSDGPPGGYLVQAKGLINAAFQDYLKTAGAEVVAYVPNNAYLVKATDASAQRLARDPRIQAVRPFEPYFKLAPALLENKPLETGRALRLTLYPGEMEEARQAVVKLGGQIQGEDRSPFGPDLLVQPQPGTVFALARLPQVQAIEPCYERELMNDLSRTRVGVSADTVVATNYLGLTGSNILVNVNDTGVDMTHPDLTGRVFPVVPRAGTDTNGHGTHVAGIIASSGLNGPKGTNVPPGSVTNANFRGKAHAAELLSMELWMADSDLQEWAAKTNYFGLSKTNTLISNNSWAYTSSYDYTMASASFDAATRDAVPTHPGAQPVLYVFSAGNAGNGRNSGQGGEAGTVRSPANGKNVIAVGGIEQKRDITNDVAIPTGAGGFETNQHYFGETDSSNQVYWASSRGNVGARIEGANGRFKPDVVAPCTFVVSTRSTHWDDSSYYNPTNGHGYWQTNVVMDPGASNTFSVFVPDNAIAFRVEVLPNPSSPDPFPDVPVYASTTYPPMPSSDSANLLGTNGLYLDNTMGNFQAGATWYYDLVNPYTNDNLTFDLYTVYWTTNDYGSLYLVLSNLNEALYPPSEKHYYRYETGTSMAAPTVSGMLALVEEFLATKLNRTASPALLKAMMINGSRSVAAEYTLDTKRQLNLQGWGLPYLPNIIPAALDTLGPSQEASWPLRLKDQTLTNCLATGDSDTFSLAVASGANNAPLRVTLAWTDPPANPVVGIKLVNDLDLIITNRDTGDVYYGNYFTGSGDFSDPFKADTNGVITIERDIVNNIENIFINTPLGTNYSITVKARRVNVDAVPQHTNGIVQDYALVVSYGGAATNAVFTLSDPVRQTNGLPIVQVLTNGMPLLKQRVGANAPLWNPTTNGTPNQWNFYVFTNDTGFTNLVFATFIPPNLSRARASEADIDLYVSTDPDLTNLLDAAVAAADKATNRGGTEMILYSNALNGVYYIGVKSEDQQAAEFSVFGVASEDPFGSQDANGNIYPTVVGAIPVDIPDGSPDMPGGVQVFAIAAMPHKVKRVVITNTITHQLFGDLIGILSHEDRHVPLFNHSFPETAGGNPIYNGTFTFIYDELGREDVTPGSRPTDGPGSVHDFVDTGTEGMWTFTFIDDALNHTGRVEMPFGMRIEPKVEETDFVRTLQPNEWFYDYVDIPADATNLLISLGYLDGSGPMEIYMRRSEYPNTSDYDRMTNNIVPPGGSLGWSTNDAPPLRAGRVFYGLHNSGGAQVTVRVVVDVQRNLTPNIGQTFTSSTQMVLLDDALTNSSLYVATNLTVASVQVGVRLAHPRLSDLVIHLISPYGTRVMLFEDRGRTNAFALGDGDYGAGTNDTLMYTVFTENTNLASQLIKFAPSPYGTNAYYATDEVLVTNGFESDAVGTYAAGTTFGNWTVQSNSVAVVASTNFTHGGTHALALADGRATLTLPTVQGMTYHLTYVYRSRDIISWWPGQGKFYDILENNGTFRAYGTPLYYAPAYSGLGYHTVPTNCMLSGPSPSLDAGTGFGFTCETWMRPYDLAPAPIIEWSDLAPGGAVGPGLWLSVTNGNGCLMANLRDTNGVDHVFCTPPNVVQSNEWQHVALTYDYESGLACIYTNGALAASTNAGPLVLQTTNYFVFGYRVGTPDESFNGMMDEMTYYRCALAEAEIQGIYQAGSLGKGGEGHSQPTATVRIGTSTNLLYGYGAWQTNVIDFVAPSNNLVLEFEGTPLGMLFDDFELTGKAGTNAVNNYYFPEEPLSAFVGQKSRGTWTLEVWDTRAGGAATNGVLLGWELQLGFVSTNASMIVLTNGQTYFGGVAENQLVYFAIDVPADAEFATNTLASITGGLLNLHFNQTVLPDGRQPGDYTLLSGVTNDFSTLGATGLPPFLQPGRRYFLAVQNTSLSGSNAFTLSVNFNASTNTAVITVLSNGVAVVTNMPAWAPTPHYYRFDVSLVASAVAFEILNPDGDVDLVVKRGLPLPGELTFDYLSALSGTNADIIVVRTNSLPVPLDYGPWYVAVINPRPNIPVQYTIRVTEMSGRPNIIPLVNAVPFVNATSAPGMTLTNYFSFTITNNDPAVEFVLTNQTGNVDMFIKRGGLPTPLDYSAFGLDTGTNTEVVHLSTNLFWPTLNGTWYIAVFNRETNDVSFDIVANLMTVWPAPPKPKFKTLTAGPTTSGLGFSVSTIPGKAYAIEISSNLLQWYVLTNWVATGTESDVVDPTPMITQRSRYYRMIQQGP